VVSVFVDHAAEGTDLFAKMAQFLAAGQKKEDNKMSNSPELQRTRNTIKELRQQTINFYEGVCPNLNCQKPSLEAVLRPADENIGSGLIFVRCRECGWAETGIDYEERTGEKLW